MRTNDASPNLDQGSDLERAIRAVHVRFGSHALVQARRLPGTEPWSTGLPALDRLSGIGGLPRGRLSILQGRTGSGKLSLALALLARATREFARVIVLDPRRGFDPWALGGQEPDLDALTVVRPPTPEAAGEAAVALARAGAGFVLALGELPEPALAPLESAAARSGTTVVVVADVSARPLAHASSLTLELEAVDWLWRHEQRIGVRARVRCQKNRVGAPGSETELAVRWPFAPFTAAVWEASETAVNDEEGGTWLRSAAG